MNPIADILQRIVDQRRSRIAQTLADVSDAHAAVESSVSDGAAFGEAIRGTAQAAIIAEVKLGSPRLGSLRGVVDPEKQARLYAENGAAALSVVVEPDFFYGSYELLTRCQRASGLPALAKDFVVHPVQLEWACRSGASAVLLIAALYTPRELRRWAEEARRLGLTPLVECHSRDDVMSLGDESWELVGINNRNLRTFEVDLEHSMSLLSSLPSTALKIAESGIANASDVARLAAAGFDAFLIGETLLKSDDPAAALRALAGAEG